MMLDRDLVNRLTNCIVYSTVKQEDDEAAWLAARTRGIGGSDIGAICGVSPFTSARQIYIKKTGQFNDGEGERFSDASLERMRFGHLLEPIVADEYMKRTDAKVKKLHVIDATLQHKDYPWALANIDRLIEYEDGTLGILECKTTGEYNKDEWDSGEILLSYIYQLNWYLWILGLTKGAFACLAGGNKFYHYEVYRNDELLNDTLIPAARAFWEENVLKLKEPALQSVDTEYVNTTYSDVVKNSEMTIEDDTVNSLAEVIVTCKADIKSLEATMAEAQNRIKEVLKDTEIGYTTDYIIKWSPRKAKRVDTAMLKKEFPQVYEQVAKESEYRVMTIKGGY